MSQLSKVAKHLRANSKTGPGITARKLAALARCPVASVHKRIYDLRVNEGKEIYTNSRIVNGQRKYFYRIAS